VCQLLVTAKVVPSSPILVTVMMEALRSSKTLFLQEPHGVTSQKMACFMVTAVKTSKLTTFLMFSRYLQRTYLPSCSQSKLEKRGGTDLRNLHLLSPHEQLLSGPYPSLLYTTDMIKKGSSDRKKVRPFGNILCYVFMCLFVFVFSCLYL
jgi:hypothetical protein